MLERPTPTLAVASHMPYWIPRDGLYLPVQAGSAMSEPIEGFVADDSGENISLRNPNYSELTVLYWIWKNLDAPAAGLVHYRRHFKGSGERGTLTMAEADALLRRAPAILPTKRRYYIETVASHYVHTMDGFQLGLVRYALEKLYPAYVDTFDANLERSSAHLFNIMLMRKDLLNAYCEWLFAVLAETERGMDFSDMTPFEARAMGRLSERLLDTWIQVNDVPFVERDIRDTEPVPWVKKGASFLAAKYLGRHYEKSF